MIIDEKVVQVLTDESKGKSPEDTLSFIADKFPGKVVFTTSFGYEDQVIADMIFRNNLPIRVVTLDTGRLFEETYKVYARTLEKYGKGITAFFPDTNDVEQLLKAKGPISFYESIENRKECCHIRKVVPLNRALAGAECWVTGLRASQSDNRSSLNFFEWDGGHKLVKFNPLLDWSLDDVKSISVKIMCHTTHSTTGVLSALAANLAPGLSNPAMISGLADGGGSKIREKNVGCTPIKN